MSGRESERAAALHRGRSICWCNLWFCHITYLSSCLTCISLAVSPEQVKPPNHSSQSSNAVFVVWKSDCSWLRMPHIVRSKQRGINMHLLERSRILLRELHQWLRRLITYSTNRLKFFIRPFKGTVRPEKKYFIIYHPPDFLLWGIMCFFSHILVVFNYYGLSP